MKTSLALSLLGLALGAFAAPAAVPVEQADKVSGLQEIQARQLSNTENDITDGSPCKALTVIFARGTTESGNVGTLAGPPFFQALYTDLGSAKVALQGVDYPANITGFLEGGDPQGSQTMANLVAQVWLAVARGQSYGTSNVNRLRLVAPIPLSTFPAIGEYLSTLDRQSFHRR